MTGIVKALRYFPEGRELTPAPLLHYLKGPRVLASKWYPESDCIELMKALAAVLKRHPDAWSQEVNVWEQMGRAGTKEYFEGLYKTLLKADDIPRSLNNFPAFWRLRHDTGNVSLQIDEEQQRASISLSGYCVVLAEQCRAINGTCWGFLRYSGAEEERIKVTHSRCRAKGDSICQWDLEW